MKQLEQEESKLEFFEIPVVHYLTVTISIERISMLKTARSYIISSEVSGLPYYLLLRSIHIQPCSGEGQLTTENYPCDLETTLIAYTVLPGIDSSVAHRVMDEMLKYRNRDGIVEVSCDLRPPLDHDL
jgi:hypothetical protein